MIKEVPTSSRIGKKNLHFIGTLIIIYSFLFQVDNISEIKIELFDSRRLSLLLQSLT